MKVLKFVICFLCVCVMSNTIVAQAKLNFQDM
mgnify:CR=1 FL=1